MAGRRSGITVAYTLLMIAGACAVMPGYIWRIADSAVPHQDIYFNMWRLSWIRHALLTGPEVLWQANIFAPERWTLAMSDAIPVEGVAASVLLSAGLSPVLIQNVLVVGAMIVSGVAMSVLARYLTRSTGAGAIAGVIFAFASYRIEHIMHLELQWTMWIPLTFLALHLVVDTGRAWLGLVVGVCAGLQLLSCVYYGVFLATALMFAVPFVVLVETPTTRLKPVLVGLGLTALVAGSIAAVYAIPYREAEQIVGVRPLSEVASYSAHLADYLAVPDSNWLYGGSRLPAGGQERRLFAGGAAVGLALFGLVRRRPDKRQVLYVLLAAVAVAMSMGTNGVLYSFIGQWVSPYRGLRVPARFAVVALFCVAVLAAYGYARLAALRPKARYALGGAILCLLFLEYHVRLQLVVYPSQPPAVYKILTHLPRGVIAEFPMPLPDTLPGREAEYQYQSTYHWFPLVNGYSGTYPPSYLRRLAQLREFPDDRSIVQLERDNVAYVIVHVSAYDISQSARILSGLERRAWKRLWDFSDGNGQSVLYAVSRR
jgi:hypothetical protein